MPLPFSPAASERIYAPQRVFIDLSHTICSGKNAGIERVVRSLVREALAIDLGPTVQLVVGDATGFYGLEKQHFDRFRLLAEIQSNALDYLPSPFRYLATGLCKLSRSSRLRDWLTPSPGHLGVLKLPHTLAKKRARKRVSRRPQVEFSQSDLLILPDAYWARKDVWQAAEKARAAGATVASIAYDLIPITHPELLGSKPNDAFVEYVRCLGRHSDTIVAISDYVREQLVAYLPELLSDENSCRDIRSFKLGCDLSGGITSEQIGAVALQDTECNTLPNRFDGSKNVGREAFIREEIETLFQRTTLPERPNAESSNVYFMVGTFEPRKNHRYLLSAFEELWSTYPNLRLCLVGHKGWQCDQLLRDLAAHPKRTTELFVFHDLTDVELQYCYQHCRGVVMPSIVEGFGLPIVEALRFGVMTFASDIPVHREVGGEQCVYFDLASPRWLANAIIAFENDPVAFRSKTPTEQPFTWNQSTEQLLQECFSAFSQCRQHSTRFTSHDA